MELRHLASPLVALGVIPEVLAAQGPGVAFSCTDANTVMVAAALRDALRAPIGVWLEVSADYPAALCARDVATLSHLIGLDHVVIASASDASSHAAVVRALLSDDVVDFENDVASIRHAYNRPAPPRPITVWSVEGEWLSHEREVLELRERVASVAGETSLFR